MRESRGQWTATLLLLLTVAAVIAAVYSFQRLRSFQLHDDGVTWVDRITDPGTSKAQTHVIAVYLEPSGPGANAQIRVGDEAVQIGPYSVHSALEVPQALSRLPVLSAATRYTLRRNGIEFTKNSIFLRAAPRDSAIFYQYGVGLAYLTIGLFVYFRRTSAPQSLHFFLLCLVSFIAASFHYSGKLNAFDQFMYWGNIVAQLLAPAIFFHFCCTFHEAPRFLRRGSTSFLIYVPSLILIALVAGSAEGVVTFSSPLFEVRWLLDRAMVAASMLIYLSGAASLAYDYAHADDPIVRHQLKYLRNGALVGLLPFALIYVLPYSLGALPSHVMNLSVLSMALIPITWAYAITRYRLMDVDIIFQQGYVYTLATLAVIGTFYGLMFFLFNTSTITPPAFVVLISFATFVFQPIRRWIQEQLDRRVFYRDRYDARLTLIEFARELSSETDLNAMLGSVADRLVRTLSIPQIAFFLVDEQSEKFHLHSLIQRPSRALKTNTHSLDLRFLDEENDKAYLFFERPRHLRDILSQELPVSVRDTLAELDFTYYVACKSRGRRVAYIGISRTTEGDFLSQDDIELLITLSNYVAIAIENSRLYSSLQRKVNEYERLKEFSENIVESINVGILAADLNDTVESWNSQIESLTGIKRDEAIGRRLQDLLPIDLCEKFNEVRGHEGVHNIYKAILSPTRKTVSASKIADSVVNIAITPLISKDLEQIGRLIIFDDVTDRDDLERRLVQADKLSSIGLLAAGVAHEVNTPLAVISTYAQMLAKQVDGDDHKSKLLEKIAKQTFRASEIVNSLLNFSRTSTTEFVEVDLNKVVKETLSLIDHQLQRSSVASRLNLWDGPAVIRGNPGKLQQVFLNLILNARDAMQDGGTLNLRTWTEAGFAHVEVADTGEGISPEHLARIYDPFFTTKGSKKGTGLGLSITYGIVQEHNGIIEVESTPGIGTRFRLEFPMTTYRVARPIASDAETVTA